MRYLRTEGLPKPPHQPDEALLERAYSRVIDLIDALKDHDEIDGNDAYNAPQYARIAVGYREYDSLYHLLKFLGGHDPYVITEAIEGMRVNGVVNTSPVLSDAEMDAATAIRGVILERHKARIQGRPNKESIHFAFGIRHLHEIDQVLEIMRRGIREPEEVEKLLAEKQAVATAVSHGAL